MKKLPFIVGGIVIIGAVGAFALNANKSPTTLIDSDREVAYELLNEAQKNAMPVDRADEMEQAKQPMNVELSYKHVVPNEYSEIYAVVTNLERGSTAVARISLGVADPKTGGIAYDDYKEQRATVDESGTAHFTFHITSRGKYAVTIVDLDGGGAIANEITVE